MVDENNLIEYALKQGADYIEIFHSQSHKIRKSISKDEKCSDLAYQSGWRITIYNQGGVSNFFSSDPQSLKKEIDKYTERASKLPIKYYDELIKRLANNTEELIFKPKKPFLDISDEEIDNKLTDFFQIIQQEGHNWELEIAIESTHFKESYFNSLGSKLIFEYPQSFLQVQAFPDISDFSRPYEKVAGGRQGLDLLLDYPEEFFSDIRSDLLEIQKASLLKPDKYDCVLSPTSAWLFVHESVGHSAEADVVLNGDSFLAGYIGQKIADTHVSIIDDPTFDKTGMKYYDHEGTKGREVRIIDHGIHNELMHNRRTASLLREKPSGNAYSDNIYNSALVRMRSIFVEPGDFAKEEILEETQNGIYIGSSIGGAVNSRTGMFNIQVQYAREIKDGELGTWYKASNINGSTLITLQKIGAIGKELMQQPAPCSKDKQ
ncbi:MAG: TldD/PmbA family protein, partial [Candidatus Heimdallarchaeota archaeon]|nr:TldD/PmbA family protein [Candidatus Heimdallarchaeota archaeon]MCK5049862.1 TldD/PmbA family protein [Candidatus Heimdallarchaeota archaeon]